MASTKRQQSRDGAIPSNLKDVAREAIAQYMKGLDNARAAAGASGPQPRWHQPRADEWTVSLVGSSQQNINVELSLGEYTLQLMSFFMRHPDENVLDVYRLLLRRNLELSGVKFGTDEYGDLYLRADLPVSGVNEIELDRVIGLFYSCADANYLPVMRLGFASQIKR